MSDDDIAVQPPPTKKRKKNARCTAKKLLENSLKELTTTIQDTEKSAIHTKQEVEYTSGEIEAILKCHKATLLAEVEKNEKLSMTELTETRLCRENTQKLVFCGRERMHELLKNVMYIVRGYFILDLPKDILVHIFEFVDVRTILRCIRVCSTFARTINEMYPKLSRIDDDGIWIDFINFEQLILNKKAGDCIFTSPSVCFGFGSSFVFKLVKNEKDEERIDLIVHSQHEIRHDIKFIPMCRSCTLDHRELPGDIMRKTLNTDKRVNIEEFLSIEDMIHNTDYGYIYRYCKVKIKVCFLL